MSDQTNQPTNPEKDNIVSFFDKAKALYYSSEYRELSGKSQSHLRTVVFYIDQYERTRQAVFGKGAK